MKYILLMNTMKAGSEGLGDWPAAGLQAHIAYMIALNKELHEAGELVGAEGLTFPNEASSFAPGKAASQSRTACSRNPRSFSRVSGSWTSTRPSDAQDTCVVRSDEDGVSNWYAA